MIRDSVLVILPLGGNLSKNVSMLSISSSVVGVTDSGCSCWTMRQGKLDSPSQISAALPFNTNIQDAVDFHIKNSQTRHFQTCHHPEICLPDICLYLGRSVDPKKRRRRKTGVRHGGGCRFHLRTAESLRPEPPLTPGIIWIISWDNSLTGLGGSL